MKALKIIGTAIAIFPFVWEATRPDAEWLPMTLWAILSIPLLWRLWIYKP
jgi:hypothetical protein